MNQDQKGRSDGNVTVTAFVLILLGAIFLLRNFDIVDLGGRWWALFLLVPLFFMGNRFLELRRRAGGGSPAEASGMLSGFLSVALVMVIFLFDLDWGDVWPLFIVLVGFSLLVGRSAGHRHDGRERSP